jgi:hypothetical protein
MATDSRITTNTGFDFILKFFLFNCGGVEADLHLSVGLPQALSC